ncbi:MAG: sterol desaturase family protein [Chitinophagales bacterium]|nr:sterol desaturase family protein [Chitinophagales bacterium]MDW8427665.1 sterol desaturase family protein [Chitinophagales bacterium]
MLSADIFGAPPITFDQIRSIDEQAPQLILWAVPLMIFFAVLEYLVARWQHRDDIYDHSELRGSVLVGLGYLLSNYLTKIILFSITVFIYNLIPWRQHFVWWLFFPCYVLHDFCSYWAHRISHEQRLWWATHVPHHSANHYNLAVSFRLSWIQQLKILFFIPVIAAGFHPLVFFVVNQVAVLFQYWVHTEYIGKLHPWIEYIFATPSNHRVHHGSQKKYLDKNFGATFIIWDRLFGTYMAEQDRPVYGLTTPIHSSNPFYLVFHELIELMKDLQSAPSWRHRLWFLFGSPITIARYKKIQQIQQKRQAQSNPMG